MAEIYRENVVDGEKANYPYEEVYEQPTKIGYLFYGWKFNNVIYKPQDYATPQQNPFGPIRSETTISAIWDKITVICECNHSIIAGEGDKDTDLTKITFYAVHSQGTITQSVTLEQMPIDSGQSPIIYTQVGIDSVVDGKNVRTIKVAENQNFSTQLYAKFRACYNPSGSQPLYSEPIEIIQLKNGQIVLAPFDYMTFTYTWWPNEEYPQRKSGKDLDSATIIRDSNLPIISNRTTLNDYFVGYLGLSPDKVANYLQHGGDNQQSGNEGAFINWKRVIQDMLDNNLLDNVTDLHLDIYANWYVEKDNTPNNDYAGKMYVTFNTYESENDTGMHIENYKFVPNAGTNPVEATENNKQQETEVLYVNAFGRPNANSNTNIVKQNYSKILEVVYNVRSRRAFLNPIQGTSIGYEITNVSIDYFAEGITESFVTQIFDNSKVASNKLNLDSGQQRILFKVKNFTQTINGVVNTQHTIDLDNDIKITYYGDTSGYAQLTNINKEGGTYEMTYICDANTTGVERNCDIVINIHTNNCVYEFRFDLYQS